MAKPPRVVITPTSAGSCLQVPGSSEKERPILLAHFPRCPFVILNLDLWFLMVAFRNPRFTPVSQNRSTHGCLAFNLGQKKRRLLLLPRLTSMSYLACLKG